MKQKDIKEAGSACVDTIIGLAVRQDWRVRLLLAVGRPLVGAVFQAFFSRLHERGLVDSKTLHELEPVAERILWPSPKTRPSKRGRGIGPRRRPRARRS